MPSVQAPLAGAFLPIRRWPRISPEVPVSCQARGRSITPPLSSAPFSAGIASDRAGIGRRPFLAARIRARPESTTQHPPRSMGGWNHALSRTETGNTSGRQLGFDWRIGFDWRMIVFHQSRRLASRFNRSKTISRALKPDCTLLGLRGAQRLATGFGIPDSFVDRNFFRASFASMGAACMNSAKSSSSPSSSIATSAESATG